MNEIFAKAFQAAIDDSFCGVVAAKSTGAIVYSSGHGFADGSSVPNNLNTLFELSSVSKQFTAAAILKLGMEGKLSVNDAMSRFCPAAPSDKATISIRQLLDHTSGIDPDFGINYDSEISRDAFLRQLLAQPLACTTGSKFDYANVNYSLLAAVIEIASGMPFERYLDVAVFQPAGLTDTGCIGDRRLIAMDRNCRRVSEGDVIGTASDWCWGWGYRGMGGVVSTAADMMRWDDALAGDAVLSREAVAMMQTPGMGNYGLGWTIEDVDGRTRVWHDGSAPGFQSLFVRYPAERAALIVLTDEKGDLEQIEEAFEMALEEALGGSI